VVLGLLLGVFFRIEVTFSSYLRLAIKLEIIDQGFSCAREGKPIPRNVRDAKGLGLQRLIPRPEFTTNNLCGVNHNDVGRSGIGIDTQESAKPHIEERFFLGLTDSGIPNTLSAIHITARENPFPYRRPYPSAQQNYPIFYGEESPGNDLWVQIKNKGAFLTHQPFRLIGFQLARFQATPTTRAKMVFNRVVIVVVIRRHVASFIPEAVEIRGKIRYACRICYGQSFLISMV
jgi:hypothetical protein